MKIKIDQKIVMVYTAIGLLAAFVSNSLSDNTTFSVLIPAVIYAAATGLAYFLEKGEKNRKKILTNSLMTFVLVWLTVWILFYNL